MQDVSNYFKRVLDGITGSDQSDQEKMEAINELIASLGMFEQNAEIRLAAETGVVLARKAGRPEMAAQFCLIRAKTEIALVGKKIAEIKNLTMAIDWFAHALENAQKRYRDIDREVNKCWGNTQAYIDAGYKLLNEQPYKGAVAYCHSTAGQIYGTYYLQLKLYYLTTGGPWRARISNLSLSMWMGLDDIFSMDRKSRIHLRKVRKDCLEKLHKALRLYWQINAREYIVDTYFDLSLEHHSFFSPVRSKVYLISGRVLMWIWGLSNSPRLKPRSISLSELPLFGSNRADRVTDELPNF